MIMKQKIFQAGLFAIAGLFLFQSCTKKLELAPTNDVTADVVYATPAGYKQVLAKVYGAFALTGNIGPAAPTGFPGDIQGIDEGFSDFYRLFWKAQELTTDEAVIAWGDAGIQDFHNMNWGTNNNFLRGLYYRSLYQITLSNDFIRECSDENLSRRGITGADADNIRQYAREAKFLRAFQYWVLMDLFGNPPFVTEQSPIGGPPPPQIKRADLFEYIETELKALETSLPATNEYGRASQPAVQALLARMFLNAQVYTQDPVTYSPGPARFTDAAAYAKKVIDAGFILINEYPYLMRADNHLNKSEFIFTINYDGLRTQGFGGTTFLTHAAVGGDIPAASIGVGGGWGGIRTTKNLPNLFPDLTGSQDKRSMFYTAGQNIEITSLTDFRSGLGVTKFRNLKRDGSIGQSQDYADIDIPLFRLAEMYLIYAEAVLRGGTGDATLALSYINKIRGRAYANDPSSSVGNISQSQLNLDFIIDERARELYWEGFRRTDLIRFNRFVESSYLWPWKGGVSSGTGVPAFRKLFPLPSSDVNANPNLKQNPGY